MTYNSTLSHNFIQQYPRFVCRTLAYRLATQERLGLAYLPKCRNPRCTPDCQANWSCKLGAVKARHLSELPSEYSRFRGNLTLPDDASPDIHRQVKARFLRLLNTWRKQHGCIVELYSVCHGTDPHNAHYDFVAYCNGPRTRACKTIRDHWFQAGGKRATCVDLSGAEIDAVCRYQGPAVGKCRPINDTKLTTTREPHFLLESREKSGLEITWHTAGFWRGSSVDRIWSELLAEWFPEPDLDFAYFLARRRADRGIAPVAKPDTESSTESKPPKPYIPGAEVQADRVRFARKLPSNPDSAVSISTYATQWGVTADYMQRILRSIPNAICLQGELVAGNHVYNSWYTEPSEQSRKYLM